MKLVMSALLLHRSDLLKNDDIYRVTCFLNNKRKAGEKAVMMEAALIEKLQGHSSSFLNQHVEMAPGEYLWPQVNVCVSLIFCSSLLCPKASGM